MGAANSPSGGNSPGTPGSSGATLSVSASNSTSISIDVSAYGDGEYLFQFTGTLTNVAKKLQITANGSALTLAQGNSVQYTAGAAVNAAATETAGTVAVQGELNACSIFVDGRFTSISGKLCLIASQFVGFGAANWWGLSTIGHFPAAALTSIQLVSTAANGLVTGTFWVRKVA